MIAATILAAAGLVGPAATPALAADLCTGTAGVGLAPGIHLTEIRAIHVTGQSEPAGSLLCLVDPLFGTLTVKTVDVHVSGTCIATSVDSTQSSTIVVRFPGESSDSTIDITGLAVSGSSLSKIIAFSGTVRVGHPHGNQNTQLVILSAGNTTTCAATAGMTGFVGGATFLFT